MSNKKQDSNNVYGETITRKKLKPLYVSLEDMIPDYSELIEWQTAKDSEKAPSV